MKNGTVIGIQELAFGNAKDLIIQCQVSFNDALSNMASIGIDESRQLLVELIGVMGNKYRNHQSVEAKPYLMHVYGAKILKSSEAMLCELEGAYSLHVSQEMETKFQRFAEHYLKNVAQDIVACPHVVANDFIQNSPLETNGFEDFIKEKFVVRCTNSKQEKVLALCNLIKEHADSLVKEGVLSTIGYESWKLTDFFDTDHLFIKTSRLSTHI